MSTAILPSISSGFHTLLVLGRVSNLPTVWTNVLAAGFLSTSVAGISLNWLTLIVVAAAMSLLYVGGMYLNDAIDADWDKQHQVKRPITEELVSRTLVYWCSAGFLLSGYLILVWLSLSSGAFLALISATCLLLAIFFYNLWHKHFPISRLLMGACRGGVYTTTALILAYDLGGIIGPAILLTLYIAGVTFLAKFEHTGHEGERPLLAIALLFSIVLLPVLIPLNLVTVAISLFLLFQMARLLDWQGIKFADPMKSVPIGPLLGLIPIIDAVLLAAAQQWWLSVVCILLYIQLPRLQRWIAPT